MNKYAVAAFIAFGVLLGVSAQAAPVSPAFVKTQAASGDAALQKVHTVYDRPYSYGHYGPHYGRHYGPHYGYHGHSYGHYGPYTEYGYHRHYYGHSGPHYGRHYGPHYGYHRHLY